LDIIKDEKGLVFGIVITIVAMSLLLLSLLAIFDFQDKRPNFQKTSCILKLKPYTLIG